MKKSNTPHKVRGATKTAHISTKKVVMTKHAGSKVKILKKHHDLQGKKINLKTQPLE